MTLLNRTTVSGGDLVGELASQLSTAKLTERCDECKKDDITMKTDLQSSQSGVMSARRMKALSTRL